MIKGDLVDTGAIHQQFTKHEDKRLVKAKKRFRFRISKRKSIVLNKEGLDWKWSLYRKEGRHQSIIGQGLGLPFGLLVKE